MLCWRFQALYNIGSHLPFYHSSSDWCRFIDGASYMAAVADGLEAAKEEIFIADWMWECYTASLLSVSHVLGWSVDDMTVAGGFVYINGQSSRCTATVDEECIVKLNIFTMFSFFLVCSETMLFPLSSCLLGIRCWSSSFSSSFLSVPLLLHSMGQIIRLLASVCLCVCLSSLLRPQFWIEFDETLHSHLGPEN